MKTYIPLAEPVLSNGSEAWIIKQQDERCLTYAEVKFLRKTAGSCLLAHKRNELVT
jgi:hypothetical protein